jgi:3-oxoacyl-(acyl-carrier-protein) synthase
MTGVGGSMVSVKYKFHGPVIACSNGSVSSACAMLTAKEQLLSGSIDIALVGGAEAPVYEEILVLFSRSGMLATEYGEPEKACKPFDRDRSGTVFGEGGAVIVLERRSDVILHDSSIYAKLAGVCITSDAYDLVAPDPDGSMQKKTIQQVLKQGIVKPEDIDYVSLHGTGTIKNDPVESQNVKHVFSDSTMEIPMSSSKGMLGHSLGACSALELVKTLIAKEGDFIPPTVNLEHPDSECDLNFIQNQAVKANIQHALVLNSSFGGKNSAILLSN